MALCVCYDVGIPAVQLLSLPNVLRMMEFHGLGNGRLLDKYEIITSALASSIISVITCRIPSSPDRAVDVGSIDHIFRRPEESRNLSYSDPRFPKDTKPFEGVPKDVQTQRIHACTCAFSFFSPIPMRTRPDKHPQGSKWASLA